jgi:hypothetical protein
MPVLFSLYFTIQRKKIRHESKERLEVSMLQTIRLKKDDFTWEKKGKEIRIGKKFFDVKSIKEENGICIITGLYDEQEDLLHEQLQNSQQEQDNPSQNKLCNFFFHFYYSIPSSEDSETAIRLSKTSYLNYFSLLLPSPYGETLSPPPNFV